MRLTCPNCGAAYDVPENAIPPEGRDVECGACHTAWFQMPVAAAARLVLSEPAADPVDPAPEAPSAEIHALPGVAETPEPAPATEPGEIDDEDWDAPGTTASAPPALPEPDFKAGPASPRPWWDTGEDTEPDEDEEPIVAATRPPRPEVVRTARPATDLGGETPAPAPAPAERENDATDGDGNDTDALLAEFRSYLTEEDERGEAAATTTSAPARSEDAETATAGAAAATGAAAAAAAVAMPEPAPEPAPDFSDDAPARSFTEGVVDARKLSATLREPADERRRADPRERAAATAAARRPGAAAAARPSRVPRGIAIVAILAGLAFAAYAYAPEIAAEVPEARGPLTDYVDLVDQGRGEAERIAAIAVEEGGRLYGQAREAVEGAIGGEEG